LEENEVFTLGWQAGAMLKTGLPFQFGMYPLFKSMCAFFLLLFD
jgi:hypothetical protein